MYLNYLQIKLLFAPKYSNKGHAQQAFWVWMWGTYTSVWEAQPCFFLCPSHGSNFLTHTPFMPPASLIIWRPSLSLFIKVQTPQSNSQMPTASFVSALESTDQFVCSLSLKSYSILSLELCTFFFILFVLMFWRPARTTSPLRKKATSAQGLLPLP